MMTRLTFENGKFVFVSPSRIKNVDWVLSSYGDEPYTYETTSLKAAVSFRQYSDDKAKKIFNRALAKSYDAPTLPPLSFLDPHQREGIEWILSRSRSYLAHAPGAGKTCQAIVAACLVAKPGPTLFIVPPTLTMNWQREVLVFTSKMGIYPTVRVVPLSSNQTGMKWSADFIICPDSMLTKSWVYTNLLKLNPKFIAVDEASRFKEPTTQRSIAFYGGKQYKLNYPGLFYKAYHTVLLDGSPMPNRPMELWAPSFYLDPASIDYLDYTSFGYRYCGATINDFGKTEFKGASHQEELKLKLQNRFMHVVPESRLNHPERQRSMLFMSEDPRTPQMKSWEKKNLSQFQLQELTDSDSQLSRYRRELGLSKVKWSSRYIRERLENKNESILVFAWHREVCEKLASELKEFKPFVVYGGVKSSEREKAFKEFQNRKRKLIIGNISAMGRGHNLQTASRVVFAEYSWTDELNKQCEKRASRRGSNKSFVRCDYIVVPDSLDEIILKAVFTKESRVKKIIG